MIALLGIASILGGLGLFFTGIRNLSATMLQLGGRPLRRAVAVHGRKPGAVALAGTVAGALLQSTNGITFILVSMVSAGLLPMVTAMPLLLWANLGTSALVILASINLQAVTLLLLGISGIWLFIDSRAGTIRRQVMEAVLALAMLFLGLELLRAGTGQLGSGAVLAAIMRIVGTSGPIAFVVGLAATLFTQSSSATTIIAVIASQLGLLPPQGAVLLVLGASLGSGASVMLMGASARGSQRQLVLFQGLTKLLGVVLLSPLILLEDATGWPLLQTGLQAVVQQQGRQLAFLYVFLQIAALAGYYLLAHPIGRLLAAVAPPLRAESLAVPQFIYDAAVGDGDIALTLAEKEQARVVGQLAATLEDPDPAVAASIERLSEEIERFLANVAGLAGETAALPPGGLDQLVNLRARNEVLRLLHDAVFQLGLTRIRMPPGEAANLADALTQGLGAVLMCADDAARDSEAENIGLLKQISSDRSTVVDAMRRRLVRAANQEAVYRLTSLFERAVWLVQRYALLLQSAQTAQ
ncbi:Na/Pi symporter [Rhodopila globiformis]|nr:Na/Pi symporter [Rhodopila globiformis]